MRTILSFLTGILGISVILGFTSAIGNEYTVNGIATDSAGVGEPYATIRYYLLPDTIKPVSTSVTGDDGSFSVGLHSAGSYRMILSSVGRTPIVKEFEVSQVYPSVALDTMIFGYDNQLDEVVVTAAKPLISREIDRIGYDVANDPESQTSQLDEMLKKVPMVSVDPDGTIRVKGSTNFKVYKNGRSNNAYSNNAKEIFKSIPASTIKRIEVITDPGAREDAEGVGVIINIVTIENVAIRGVVGSAGLNMDANSNIPNPNLWLTSQIEKVTFSVGGGMWSSPSRSGVMYSVGETKYDESDNSLYNRSTQRSSSTSVNFNTELSWDIDSLNLVTMEFWGWFSRSNSRSATSTEMNGSDGSPIYSYDSRDVISPSNNHWLGGTANYQHLMHRKGEKLILSYNISGNGSSNRKASNYFNQVNMPVDYTGIYADNKAIFLEQIVQADWTRPLHEHHTLDVGAKYIHRNNHSHSTQNYLGSHDYHNDFFHITQVGAIYADYRFNISRWGLRAGLRYEYSRLAAKYRDKSYPDFHSNLSDLVPNGAVSFNINDRNSMRLSYSMNINRPGIMYLNPTVNRTPQSVSEGNPDLSSIRNHSLNFNYSFFGPKFSLDFTSGYTFADNAIIETRQLLENDIIYTTYENAGRTHSFYSNVWMNLQAGSKTRLMSNIGINYAYNQNPSVGIHMRALTPNVYLRLIQDLPFKISGALSVSYWGGSRSLYSVFESVGISGIYQNISVSRKFLNDRLNAQFTLSNPIGNGRRTYRSYSCNMPYESNQRTSYSDARLISIHISYRFGSLNTQVKKVRSVESGDVVGGPSR